jgi:uncharacterized protein (TIGR03790 family)
MNEPGSDSALVFEQTEMTASAQRKASVIHRVLFSVAILLGGAGICAAELKPAEIAVVAAKGNRESEALAKYYVKARNIPAENICLVDMPREEVLPREMWQWGVRPEIQKWLNENDPQKKLRCLVTVWGVPLKIDRAKSDEDLEKYRQFLEAERSHRVKLLDTIRGALDGIAPKGELAREDVPKGSGKAAETNPAADAAAPLFASTADARGEKADADGARPAKENAAADAGGAQVAMPADLQAMRQALEKSLQDAQARLAKLPSGDARTRGQVQLQQLATAAGGSNVLLQGINQRLTSSAEPNTDLRSEFDVLRGRASAMSEIKSLLDQTSPSIERDALVLAILERLTGVIGTVEWLDVQLGVVRQNETGASFDSELSLVMWPDDFQLLRWQPNYLRPGFDNSQLPKVYRTFMVSRIDAPTLALAKGLVDTAMKVESEGLQGKVYIDGRGMNVDGPNISPGSYEDYDRSLLVTAKGIEELTDMEVVTETTPELFQPGKCPDAALYCGWYSLGKYVDAFDWKPGAVAYHLASIEADTLRDPASQVWCKKLLEDGVCATIGPVYEPYLAAFPRPNEFFAMLVEGNLTLVECYARSQPFNSWMMTLIGDPLYRPFKNRAEIAPAHSEPAISTGAVSTGAAAPPPAPR